MKTCTKCHEIKPLTSFHKNRRNKSGYQSWCRECLKTHAKGRRPQRNAATLRWYYRNQDKVRRYNRKSKLRISHGITPEQFDKMLEDQEGLCAICSEPPTKGMGKILHVDHDHITGRIRALLCHSCNTGLGAFKDSPALLRVAAGYLEDV